MEGAAENPNDGSNRGPSSSSSPSASVVEHQVVVLPGPLPRTKPHIFIGTPCYGGQVTDGFTTSLVKTAVQMSFMGDVDLTYQILSGISLISLARNSLVSLFLKTDCTHLVFIDSDITFNTQNVLRLLEASKTKPICAATYPKKQLDISKLRQYIKDRLVQDPGHDFTEEELNHSMIDYSYSPHSEDGYKGQGLPVHGGFVQVPSVGAGFLMIRRDVLLTMIQNYRSRTSSKLVEDEVIGLFETMIDPVSRRSLADDFAFCRRARGFGFSVWMDLETCVKHEGGCFTFQGQVSRDFIFHNKTEPSLS